jgi:glycosyltransferase involved in cell wall biosynthesis
MVLKMEDKVSVIISTYNRYKYLKRAIESVKQQTYTNVEIIAVNDCSMQIEYYEDNWEGITMIHLPVNSRQLFGHASSGFVKNRGVDVATGKYIAYLDDDDIWLPRKLELQIKAMKETGSKLSSTDGLIGNGIYNPNKQYKRYNAEYFYEQILNIFHRKGSTLLDNGFPTVWNAEFVNVHNCMICSSVVIEKELLKQIGYMNCLPIGQEDYDCWRRAIPYTNSVYINDICFYYDMGHGDGQDY